MNEYLFAYGTLQDASLLQRLLGRTVPSRIAYAHGWVTQTIMVEGDLYLCAIRGDGVLAGRLIEITRDELGALDEYETTAYDREELVLHDGVTAWIYVKRR